MTKKQLNDKIRKNGIYELTSDEFDLWFFYNWSLPYYRAIWYPTLKERVGKLMSIKRRMIRNLGLAGRYVGYFGYSNGYLKDLLDGHYMTIYYNKLDRLTKGEYRKEKDYEN